jgi:starch synthase
MKILFASSEMAPYIKTGGLADVAGSLPRAMAERGHEVAVMLPLYGGMDRDAFLPQPVPWDVSVSLPIGRRTFRIWQVSPAGTGTQNLRIFFHENNWFFDRPQLYSRDGMDYPDNPFRFGYWCLSVLESLKKLNWQPDILHCNDWQTAMIPVYLRFHPAFNRDPFYQSPGTLFSIHNMAYQGLYPLETGQKLGLPAAIESHESLEFYGQLNLLKGGLLYSARLVTVSPKYAVEIMTPEYGCGLEGVIQKRSGVLNGVMNGIDTRTWDPSEDPLIPANYAPDHMDGKIACKKDLQEKFGLRVSGSLPLVAMISRLTDQKGLDLLVEILPQVLDRGCQFILLGTGDEKYHRLFGKLAAQYPDFMGIKLGFDETLAHRIEAGADIYVMPSRFEPCGLSQFYSLRYGTVPVVRNTGGLANSVTHASLENIHQGRANGFVFDAYSSAALLSALNKAIMMYQDEKDTWSGLVRTGMEGDYSWGKSAAEYEKLMDAILQSKRRE